MDEIQRYISPFSAPLALFLIKIALEENHVTRMVEKDHKFGKLGQELPKKTAGLIF